MILQQTNIPLDVFGYTRVSGKGQVNGFGPERQRDDILSFAGKFNFQVVNIYEDAYTGTEADRPQFMEMLAAMIETGPKILIVESLDRLARDLTIQTQILAKLGAEGITLYAANTGEDVTAAMQDDPMRKAMIQIQGVFAELDKSLLVRKLRKGREAKKRRDGRCEGQKPYGSLPGEEVVLDRVAELLVRFKKHPQKWAKIRDVLNDEGFTLRPRAGQPGRPFSCYRVREIATKTLPTRASCEVVV